METTFITCRAGDRIVIGDVVLTLVEAWPRMRFEVEGAEEVRIEEGYRERDFLTKPSARI